MVPKKKILIDAGKLKHRNTGLGEVAFNFATELVKQHEQWKDKNFEFYFLVPKNYIGAFGNGVKYIPLNFFTRHLPFVQKKFNLWHALHQDSAYMPGTKKCFYLLTVHDLFAVKRLEGIYKKIKRANALAAISNFTSAAIRKQWPVQKPVTVIYNGVGDISNLPQVQPAGITANDNFYFHVSSLMPKKNIIALLGMMQLMPDKKLVIAGSFTNKYGRQLTTQIQSMGLQNIICLHDISNEQKAWLYAHCQAFLFPSLSEGFGLPVIEAMHFGKPVFISTLSSLPEIGGDKAFYFNTFEAVDMKDTLLQKTEAAKNNPAFIAALKKHARNFSWQKNVQAYLKWYDSILLNPLQH
jgi:glycosyltransferase involved in cell wall biosynthesis